MTNFGKTLGGAVATTICLASAATAAERVDFILNWTVAGSHAPIYYALQQGWFEEAGVDLRVETGKGSTLAAQKVGVGASDMGIADLGTTIVARGAGADLVAVMNIFANSPYQFYWLKSSGIESLRDFSGRKLGNPPGDAARAMWPAVAAAEGLEPDAVDWVNIAPNAKVSALKSGAIDGTSFFANFHYVMQDAFGDDLAHVALRDVGLNPYGNSVVANGDWLEANPELADATVKTLQRAYRYCVDHSEECVSVLPDYASGVDPDQEIRNWSAVVELMTDETSRSKGLGWFDPDRIVSDIALVEKYFDVASPIEAENLYTNELLDPSVTMP
ncbi:MAG: nitrate ABC transporter substrate-binding protein [Rhodobacteraceae bacterium]|mgnify:CR=1 FL=1|jgi:NitT/TauT family transport system substrate-binding protein|uniref:NitT/TauT family transport system substrate-binding protein n=1 Tax=Salipiger profundus TaxID=1229727 RepID=A0A1U7D2Q8_9RHOB|nr:MULTISPECIES: ABC transporter substrate-binding protein [Salipiger]APX22388.1 NitT/TauT family transport system substrate-binding protein [Salipiger profundus]MAB05671.1 nitrate ABC transporter substrate-binding protein [Paracoccaceae bacterium]GGA22879.1 nitrate ABC transporter substrate-binding protein [Salipiger profundus]SFD65207.1 NitT/TauT family transport system substrate-binding protein [Salipiger profundus]